MKRGDTTPWTLRCLDGEPPTQTPADLTNAQRVRFLGARDNTTVIDTDIADRPPDGVITYHPAAADVATAGTMRLEVEVTWPDNSVQTFPSEGQAILPIEPDIG